MEPTHSMNSLRKFLFFCSLLVFSNVSAAQRDAWVATWAASPEPGDPDPNEPMLNLEDQTVRERMRVSIGGSQIRLRLSNEYGSTPLVVGAVTVGIPADPASIKSGSMQKVTFSGRDSVTIPADAPVFSDPVPFPLAYGSEISVSLYFPKRVSTVTWHQLALKRAVISPHGDHTQEQKIEGGTESSRSILLTAVLVPAQRRHRLVAALGDSIVDGDGSTMDTDHNWPSSLIRRIGKNPASAKVAVVNEGIAGNRLLHDGPLPGFGVSALARFDRDVLALPALTHIILLEGINDIGMPGAKLHELLLADPADAPRTEDLIAAYGQLIARAHLHGVKIIGATLTPCEGVDLPGYYSEAKETTRQAVNKWIRTSAAFDAIIDFDKIVRDPDHPSRLLPRFDSDDHLHPNDAGYQAMADAIDLNLFR